MLYALNPNKDRVEATPGERAYCPHCGKTVIAKCGKINIWHWSHEVKSDCDSWAEHETEWHLGWKRLFHPDCVEKTIKIGNEIHRADVVTAKYIIELQHSPISIDEINQRQDFYGEDLIWLFDISGATQDVWETVTFENGESINYVVKDARLELRPKYNAQYPGEFYTFRWKNAKKHIAYAKHVALDLGNDQIFILQKMCLSKCIP
jgi:hypothetical protein